MAASTEHTFAANPDTFDIRRRSKHGCIDCKAAKVRCDEVHPACGTCARRRRVCRGYNNNTNATKPPAKKRQKSRNQSTDIKIEPAVAAGSYDSMSLPPLDDADGQSLFSEPTASASGASACSPGWGTTPASYFTPSEVSIKTFPYESFDTSNLYLLPRSLPVIPSSAIPEADGPTINVYFNRHPIELVISAEFVEEMNASILLLLQDSPAAIGDALYSIGRVYLDEESLGSPLPLALDRRARILARLRDKDPSCELEQMLAMTLALGAMDLIDTKCKAIERTFPIVIGYAARIINNYLASGLELSSLAKYFVRGLARQDMVLSLSQCRRNSIRTELWLDEAARSQADRFMGYTATLMPLLEELCALAEDVFNEGRMIASSGGLEDAPLTSWSVTNVASVSRPKDDLQSRLQSWRPTLGHCVSARTSRRLLAQAYATRAAAVLMLHRLMHPAGSSAAADSEAFQLACEVMVHLNGEPDDLRLSTWPALVAACELQSVEDRAIAMGIFDAIYNSRKTGTPVQTKYFVSERVWKARDVGGEWDWMMLSRRYPRECLPI